MTEAREEPNLQKSERKVVIVKQKKMKVGIHFSAKAAETAERRNVLNSEEEEILSHERNEKHADDQFLQEKCQFVKNSVPLDRRDRPGFIL